MDQQPVVLLAESDALISMDLSDTLEKAGYRVLGPADTVAAVMYLLEQERPTVAVIDVVLKDGSCTELAHTLRHRAVPFLLHSAYRQDQQLAGEFQGVLRPRVE
jgi:DNA-binding response OmpR family regulator